MRVRNGALVTGLTVTVQVLNVITGTTLLSTTTMSEVVTGVYSFNWNHTLTAFTSCVALYTVGGFVYPENFQVDESLDKEESLSGNAT